MKWTLEIINSIIGMAPKNKITSFSLNPHVFHLSFSPVFSPNSKPNVSIPSQTLLGVKKTPLTGVSEGCL